MNKESRHHQKATHPHKARITVWDIVSNVFFTLSLVAVIVVIVKCVLMAISRDGGDNPRFNYLPSHDPPTTTHSKGHKHCCLPYKFQAVVTPLATFNAQLKQVMRVYRDWDARLQAMEITMFDDSGIAQQAYSKTIYDYTKNTAYRIGPGETQCASWEINSGMLEPCMPDDSEYLGKSYVGFYGNKAEFDSFYFRRTDKNRNIEMTIAVTSDECVPVMEHITGTVGAATTDSLIFFSNFTSLQDNSVFTVPNYCINKPDE